MSTSELHYRACILCEAMCGLEVEHAGGEVVGIRGDTANHFSKGHICPKGNALQDLHADPERIRRPLKRNAQGEFEPVDWDVALDDIADRLVAIQHAHGRDAVGFYTGNPSAHHLGAGLALFPLLAALGTRNRYGATSQDQLPHSLAALKLFGHFALFPVPDIDRTDLFLCLGGNPLASNGSVMSAPGFRHRVRDLQARGGRFVVVDPRRTESANVADEHLFIRPGSDAWLLLAMLSVIFAEGLEDLGSARSYVDGLGELQAHVAAFTPEDATARTGIAADDIRRLAREFATTPRAVAYGRVGLCTQEFGGLSAYLVYVLNIVTGKLDREGGVMFTTPAVDPLPLAHAIGWGGTFDTFRSRVSGLPEFAGELPSTVLAEEMETPGEGQLRALLVHAGNPVLSAPNGPRIERALPGLELMVCFDFYLTETTRHADYILPPTGPLESPEYDLVLNVVTVRDVAHFSPALFDKPEGARYDWEALVGLTTRLLARGPGGRRARAAGRFYGALYERLGATGMLDLALRTGPYGQPAAAVALLDKALGRTGPTRAAWGLLTRSLGRSPLARFTAPPVTPLPDSVPRTGLTLDVLKAHPHGLDLGPLQPRLPARLFTPDKRVPLVHDLYTADLERLRAVPPADGLVLIGRRHLRSNNSWMHNSRRLVKGRSRCTLMIHPEDASARGLADGDTATVASRSGAIDVPVEVTDDLMPGVVSIPHGWGHHREGTGWTTAEAHAGVSVNDITDDRFIDRMSGTSALNGVPVEVRSKPAAVGAVAAAHAVPAVAGE
ncbi:dimethyl sulfoxide reductase DmsA [Paraconexibacter sp. AEG42_29]|uniref:Dimethyl sulfoxide reductase DmsA n=1 Tax=Paraconexibacter sp. AEG42_29 TaxID=2997339 RepID=A0AAU7B1E1_9ACTN